MEPIRDVTFNDFKDFKIITSRDVTFNETDLP